DRSLDLARGKSRGAFCRRTTRRRVKGRKGVKVQGWPDPCLSKIQNSKTCPRSQTRGSKEGRALQPVSLELWQSTSSSRTNALDVLWVPELFSNPVTCFMHGQGLRCRVVGRPGSHRERTCKGRLLAKASRSGRRNSCCEEYRTGIALISSRRASALLGGLLGVRGAHNDVVFLIDQRNAVVQENVRDYGLF